MLTTALAFQPLPWQTVSKSVLVFRGGEGDAVGGKGAGGRGGCGAERAAQAGRGGGDVEGGKMLGGGCVKTARPDEYTPSRRRQFVGGFMNLATML